MADTISHGVPTHIDSEYFALIKAGFLDQLAQCGVPIVSGAVTKQCICGPIREAREQDPIGGASHHFETTATMLAEDYELFETVLNVTEVVIDEETMTIVRADRHPQDPCVHLKLSRDY